MQEVERGENCCRSHRQGNGNNDDNNCNVIRRTTIVSTNSRIYHGGDCGDEAKKLQCRTTATTYMLGGPVGDALQSSELVEVGGNGTH
jgi:hypothetical protein